jgi:hypothetical protein
MERNRRMNEYIKELKMKITLLEEENKKLSQNNQMILNEYNDLKSNYIILIQKAKNNIEESENLLKNVRKFSKKYENKIQAKLKIK